jgi:hypothetical protein
MSVVLTNPRSLLSLIQSASCFCRIDHNQNVSFFTKYFFDLNSFNHDNSLFIELLPLLGGFDIAVLAFAIQFFAEIFNRLQNEAGQYRSRKMILTDKLERDFKYLSTCFGSHLVLTLLLIFVSSIKFMHENINFLVISSFLLMLFTFFLIVYAISFCRKLIFEDSRNLDVERVIERLDELMSIHKL